MSVGCLAEEPNGKADCSVSSDDAVICLVNKEKKFGVVKYIGKTEFSSGVWYGVELSEPLGKNDGAVAGKRYFKCAENHGIFVNPNNVYPAKSEYETRSIVNGKQVKRRVLPNVVQEDYPIPSDNVLEGNEMSEKVLMTKACSDGNFITNGNDLETPRPRSKSDNALEKGTDKGFLFSNSPFKCNIKEGKSSSLPKLDNVTYICHSPIMHASTNASNKEDVQHPRHSSPLSAFCKNDHPQNATLTNACQDSEGSSAEKTSKPSHNMHLKLSPHFEVKQSIKIGSIGRFSLKGQQSGLNKTFLINKDSLRQERNKIKSNNHEKKMVDPPSEVRSESKENCKNIKNVEKRGTVYKKQQPSKNASSTVVNTCESDGIEARSRSVSKSSLSSVESFSSVGSTKTSSEKSRLKSTGTSNKLPSASEASKTNSKFVKMSTESKLKAKRTEKVASSTMKGIPVSFGEKPLTNEKGLINKSRTKSTSVFGSESGLVTPASAKTNMKPKSRSVSSDYNARVTSKFSTPLASKISGNIASRRSTTTPLCTIRSKLTKASSTESTIRKPPMSVIPSNRVKAQRTLSQESNKSENNSSTKQIKKKVKNDEKRANRQEDNKVALTKTRNLCTSRPESGNSTNYAGVNSSKSLVSRGNENLSVIAQGLRAPRKVSEKSGERSVVKKKGPSEALVKRKPPGDDKTDTRDRNLASCLSSAVTPDILKQTPEVIRQSVGVQVGQDSLEYERFTLSLADQCKNEQDKVESLVSQLSRRNRDFEAILIVLQVYSQKVDTESKNVESLINCIDLTKKKCLNAEKTIAKETGYRVRLEDEMLSVKSDSVVELALLRVQYERKQDLMQDQLMEDCKQDLEKGRRRHVKTMDELKRSCDLKLNRVEETYVQDIAHINERHKNDIAVLELQHSKDVEELVEERYAEIETIKDDYEEQMEELKNRLSESHEECHQLNEKLRIGEVESKRDIELRIQDAIAKYKSLPDELESMKFVLEMKNNELKKLRQCNMALRNQIDELQRVKNRATLLEREKESLNFVVENKVQFERQLSLERDKLRRSLDREVAASKRLSLENEELTWRLNSFQNSPTSPTFERFNWRMSGTNSPDSAVFSQMIEESDLELQMDDMKEATD